MVFASVFINVSGFFAEISLNQLVVEINVNFRDIFHFLLKEPVQMLPVYGIKGRIVCSKWNFERLSSDRMNFARYHANRIGQHISLEVEAHGSKRLTTSVAKVRFMLHPLASSFDWDS